MFIKLNEFFQKLLELGYNKSLDLFKCAILSGSIPASYDGLVTDLKARNEESTSTLVCSKAIAENKRRSEGHMDNKEDLALRVISSSSKKTSSYFCRPRVTLRVIARSIRHGWQI